MKTFTRINAVIAVTMKDSADAAHRLKRIVQLPKGLRTSAAIRSQLFSFHSHVSCCLRGSRPHSLRCPALRPPAGLG